MPRGVYHGTIARMESTIIEVKYPIGFHKEDSSVLGEHLSHGHNVVMIGMKRVGISNFLRFFLHHKDISTIYIKDKKKHLFIPIELNDLVEIELFPFWTLTLKRILDNVEGLSLPAKDKKTLETIFSRSIQMRDLFLVIDGVKKTLNVLIENGITPTLFFIQFDRIKNVVTPEFFANLQGLRDATNRQVSYVFTSFRSLDSLSSVVFPKSSLNVFSHNLYIRPVEKKDAETIYETFKKLYKLNLSQAVKEALFEFVDGYVRYLHLSLIILAEKKGRDIKTKEQLLKLLLSDERMSLQSEELWESLVSIEKEMLKKIVKQKKISKEEKGKTEYLWDTGFVDKEGIIFSPLFVDYILSRKSEKKEDEGSLEFTKKEKLLFELLKEKNGEVCEREEIIDKVWPEVVGLGVTDWAIDRLAARVRAKLKLQKSNYEIQTVKTRGYKLLGNRE